MIKYSMKCYIIEVNEKVYIAIFLMEQMQTIIICMSACIVRTLVNLLIVITVTGNFLI